MKNLKINIIALAIIVPSSYLISNIVSVTGFAVALGAVVASCLVAYYIATNIISPKKMSVSDCISIAGNILELKYPKVTLDNIEQIKQEFNDHLIILLGDSSYTGDIHSLSSRISNKVAEDLYQETIKLNNRELLNEE